MSSALYLCTFRLACSLSEAAKGVGAARCSAGQYGGVCALSLCWYKLWGPGPSAASQTPNFHHHLTPHHLPPSPQLPSTRHPALRKEAIACEPAWVGRPVGGGEAVLAGRGRRERRKGGGLSGCSSRNIPSTGGWISGLFFYLSFLSFFVK